MAKTNAHIIVPLASRYLSGATAVAEKVFAGTNLPGRSLAASLTPSLADAHDDMGHIQHRRFWLAVDERDHVLGTVGLYVLREDASGPSWVNWFCVDPAARGKGVGTKLLEHVIAVARQEGNTSLRLWTTNSATERDAQFLYEKMGFIETSREEVEAQDHSHVIYREKTLP